MVMGPKVYVLHPVRENLSSAASFGALTYIGRDYVYGDELEPETAAPPGCCCLLIPLGVAQRLQQVARDFRPDSDYLMIAGDHLQLVALAAALSRLHGSFRVLRYDRKAEGYLDVRIAAPAGNPGCGGLTAAGKDASLARTT